MHHVVAVKVARDEPEAAGQKYAGQRAGDGDVEFLLGAVGLASDSRQATENKKRDGSDWNAVVLGDRAMAQLVEYHGSEKQNTSDDAEGPMLGRGPIRVLRGELSSQRKRDQEENDEPTGVQIDGDAENTSNPKAGRRSRILSRNRWRPGRGCQVRGLRGLRIL